MMLVDCRTCPVREKRCPDCMVTALARLPVGPPSEQSRTDQSRVDQSQADQSRSRRRKPADLPLDPAERRAVSMFLAAGLVTKAGAQSLRAVPDRAPASVDRAAG